MKHPKSKNRVIVLIDAENIHKQNFLDARKSIIDKFGNLPISYNAIADFSKSCTANIWKQLCFEYCVEPIHFFSYGTKGQNQSDFSLSCYAASLLDEYEHFILLTNDSDFVSLAIFLKHRGVYVTGIGENPSNFLVQACDEYIIAENNKSSQNSNIINFKNGVVSHVKIKKRNAFERNLLLKTFKKLRKDNDGYVPLGVLKQKSGVETDKKFSQYITEIDGFILSADCQKVRLEAAA